MFSHTLSKQAEYFLVITKQEGNVAHQHHSVILGAMNEEGNPVILTRVGKLNNIDPDYNDMCTMALKYLGDTSLARIGDEKIYKDSSISNPNAEHPVSYQAYSITYDQTNQFLQMIAEVERKQLKSKAIKKGMRAFDRKIKNKRVSMETALNSLAICSYVPAEDREESNQVVFEYKRLQDCEQFNGNSGQYNQIAKDGQELHVTNTCRHSAVDILERILGVAINITKFFFATSLKYKMTLKFGQLDKDTFYILPPPPPAKKPKHLTTEQHETLIRMYEKLEDIPTTNPASEVTRNKFNALKKIYLSIAGENNLSAHELMKNIDSHLNNPKIKKDIFAKRGLFSSSTGEIIADIYGKLKVNKMEVIGISRL